MSDLSGIAAQATAMSQQRVSQEYAVTMAKKTMDVAQQQGEAMIEMMNSIGQGVVGPGGVDIRG
ncbi:YjfB family protein [Chrysiogenes arsenatis]|uniref:YjfB family protein n=1 Tax=Chrysiogenes arsenatis TaxID=309797 RepID=UPI000422F292|nr:YjfB family protein [Chrysiogenes arsenatis]